MSKTRTRRHFSAERAELPPKQLLGWLEDWERQAILNDHDSHRLNGYRRLTFMMLDNDIVAVSPSSVYRVLREAGRLDRSRWAPSKKVAGFIQPDGPH